MHSGAAQEAVQRARSEIFKLSLVRVTARVSIPRGRATVTRTVTCSDEHAASGSRPEREQLSAGGEIAAAKLEDSWSCDLGSSFDSNIKLVTRA